MLCVLVCEGWFVKMYWKLECWKLKPVNQFSLGQHRTSGSLGSGIHFGSHFDFLLLVLVQFSPHYGVGHGLLLSCRVRDYRLSLQRNLAERLKRTQEVWTLPWVSNLLSDDNRQTEGFFSAVFFFINMNININCGKGKEVTQLFSVFLGHIHCLCITL